MKLRMSQNALLIPRRQAGLYAITLSLFYANCADCANIIMLIMQIMQIKWFVCLSPKPST